MNKEARPIKVYLGRPGSDAHSWGVGVLGQGLRDAGMEVVLGMNLSINQIAEGVIQEDPDIVAISATSDGAIRYMPVLMKTLKDKGIDKPVLMGGYLSPSMIPKYKELGVEQVFLSGVPLDEIIAYFKKVGERVKVSP